MLFLSLNKIYFYWFLILILSYVRTISKLRLIFIILFKEKPYISKIKNRQMDDIKMMDETPQTSNLVCGVLKFMVSVMQTPIQNHPKITYKFETLQVKQSGNC